MKFIDLLFAVVIGQSFALLNSEQGFRPWLRDPWPNAFGLATLLLIYTLVITSWIGYHQSTQKYPIKQLLRFIIDVALLFIYYMGFVNASDFGLVNWMFFAAFLLYAIWDAVRILEYQVDLTRELWKRLIISIGFSIVFFANIYIYRLFETELPEVKWAFFMAVLVLLVLYRYLKWYRK